MLGLALLRIIDQHIKRSFCQTIGRLKKSFALRVTGNIRDEDMDSKFLQVIPGLVGEECCDNGIAWSLVC